MAAAPALAPAGFRLATTAGAALVGLSILYRWPAQGWVLGKVVRVSQVAWFSHGVRYPRGSALHSLGVGQGRQPSC